MYDNAAVANENARLAIMKQGEMVSCLSQLSHVLSSGLNMSNLSRHSSVAATAPQHTRTTSFPYSGAHNNFGGQPINIGKHISAGDPHTAAHHSSAEHGMSAYQTPTDRATSAAAVPETHGILLTTEATEHSGLLPKTNALLPEGARLPHAVTEGNCNIEGRGTGFTSAP